MQTESMLGASERSNINAGSVKAEECVSVRAGPVLGLLGREILLRNARRSSVNPKEVSMIATVIRVQRTADGSAAYFALIDRRSLITASSDRFCSRIAASSCEC